MNNQIATDSKIARSVVSEGDMWLRTGDLMKISRSNYLYFVDRLGDTCKYFGIPKSNIRVRRSQSVFCIDRWKSENTSTTEVSAAFGGLSDIIGANVYGVLVPYHDGRAGCAALTLKAGITPKSLDYRKIYSHLSTRIRKVSLPVFLRILPKCVQVSI